MPVHSMVDRRRKLHAEALAAHPDWPVIPMASVIEIDGRAAPADRRLCAPKPRRAGIRIAVAGDRTPAGLRALRQI
jgi:hypothetical protein